MTDHSQAMTAKYRQDYQAPLYWIDSIDLDFQLQEPLTLVTAISRLRRNGEHNEPLVLDGEGLSLHSVSVDGVPYQEHEQGENTLTLFNLPAECVLTIVTLLDPAANTALEGLYKSGDAYCTQCEAEGFRRITYYLDRPDILARYSTRITADKAKYPFLLSNGNKVDSGELDGGRHFVQWQDPFPKPSYLFALVAGDFDVERSHYTTKSGRKVALEIFVDKGNLDRAGFAMESLINSMRWDEQRFGLEYDLDIYMIVAVDFFNMGAMENKGLNVFNSKFVLANPATATDSDYHGIERVIGHEYFHNWTGNRVTCRDWFQLSLKEGLTVFRDQEFSSDLGSRGVNRINNVRTVRGPQFAEDAGPMAHPIRPDVVIEMNNFYTLTVYEKGSEVIRMLHTLLGEDNFQAGMRLYFERFDGQAVTCDDFVQAMEDASGVDLGRFRRWYSQSGTPELTVTDEYDAASGVYRLHVSQHTPPTQDQPQKLPLHIPLDIELYDQSGAVIPLQYQGKEIGQVLDVLEAEQTFIFDKVPVKPVPSLLRDFSAPVKLHYDYSDEALAFLMRHARNEFARWDAAQMLINKAVMEGVVQVQHGQGVDVSETLLAAFVAILDDASLDPALKAEILALAGEATLAELFEVADIDAIHQVRDAIHARLAAAFGARLATTYASLQLQGYQVVHADMAKRALKGVVLGYLAALDAAHADALVRQQYANADNMTDTLAALQVANGYLLPCRSELLADFEGKWARDGLVLDNWLRLVGSKPATDVLSEVRQAMAHPTFSIRNPNRLRALIGSFAMSNQVQFHAIDGSGYRFLTDILIELNEVNPQVASRLITPLIQFKRLDEGRKALIRAELLRLFNLDGLARDLFEKVSKALQQ
ncbi:aminopeptidase N [Aeromonas salmonicida]|uniref:aminopeptidase N n=1 Tax=Aeromonas salmonicida TaxID=645 RepID=UPI00073C4A34|nr:aminopeptidase N [Aeromonas salmonicida]KTA81663.1 aminopeptidase N [Aeromonas salmonicida]MDE7527575.1 aminopeptidase N [Aeromonas salmonicida]MDE7531924.1 aminopeptidase N [Aeromonas salmonicida]